MRYLAAITLALSLFGADAFAQGIILERIIIDPPRTPPRPPRRWPIRLKEHRVQIRIQDQVAQSEVVQIFHNANAWPVEGVYLFPLPDNASVSRFTMRMGGKDITGEILDAKRAGEIYRSIVYRRRDPGLLEYAGRRCIRARIFPIPPRGDTKITLRFEQVLAPVGGVVEMIYPLRSDKFAPGRVRISGSIDVSSGAGVATVFSPTHKLDVVRRSETHVVASFEETASRADRDLRVLYGLGRKNFGLALATHKPAGEDGYFLMLISPNTGAAGAEVLPKDIVFVLDTSGSMGDRGGKKLRQAKAALGHALGRLAERDRFNVIAFATEARPFRDGVVAATRENVAAAIEHVNRLEATGGTAIHDALLAALRFERTEGRVPIVFFLTDGTPTIGPTESETILGAVSKANRAQARLFVFGVGDDVNTRLLCDLAAKSRGSGHYVAENENIEVKVSALYDQVASPVLTDVTVKMEGAGEYDVYPRRVGDLFRGQQVLIVGRYRKAGPRAVTLAGRLGRREVSLVYEGTFGSGPGRDYLPRLWAVRKVGFLLAQIRQNGEQRELVAEVKRLGTRHGIVTPYTSFLVVEEREMLRRLGDRLLPTAPAEEGRRLRGELDESLRALDEEDAEMSAVGGAFKKKAESGRGAVAGARLSGRYQGADRADREIGVKTVGSKTFRYSRGTWVDADLAAHGDADVVRVKYLSEGYAALLEDLRLARFLSVGESVRVYYGGRIYEITK
ncbi:MAG: VIT and vWA domain-containing protein [Planctomycetota bacterium]|jgi:Ca-activated chloride channel family protein